MRVESKHTNGYRDAGSCLEESIKGWVERTNRARIRWFFQPFSGLLVLGNYNPRDKEGSGFEIVKSFKAVCLGFMEVF